jgi:hypothetical protein
VDIFPHTNNFSIVFLFLRVSMNDLVNPQLVNADSYKRGCTSAGTTSYPEPTAQGQKPPDLRWQKVTPKPAATDAPKPPVATADESGLSPEQVSWLNQMTDIYGDQFERQQWTESFRQQNMEATMAAMAAAPVVQPPLPPAPSVQPPVPAAPAFQPPMPPTSTDADPSQAWAAYSKQYREYKEWWDKHGAAYAAAYPQSAGTSNPEAWNSYNQMPSTYYPGYTAQNPAPPLPTTPAWQSHGPAPPLPKTPAPK